MRSRGLLFVLLFGLLVHVAALAESQQRTFTWSFAMRAWTLDASISVERYRFFRTQPRLLGHTNYTGYVTDERDDDDLERLIGQLGTLAADAGFDAWQRLNFVIAFVQAIPYASEDAEYPRYPLETLYEQRGDCEDLSILAAALLRAMGFDVILLAFVDEGHMAIGVNVQPQTDGTHAAYEWNQRLYYYVETTYPGWAIGQQPIGFLSPPSIVAFQPTTLAAPQQR